MQKTRLGISVGLLGAATYFAGLFSGLLAALLLAGYVLMFEENEWLRRSVVKAITLTILFQFANGKNGYKVAKDKDNEIFEIYRRVRKYPEYIKVWLDLMSYSKCSFETIPVCIKHELTDDEKLLKLCSYVVGSKKMVVYSLQNLPYPIDVDRCIEYNGNKIKLLDRDEISIILNSNVVMNNQLNISGNVENSIVAAGNVIDSENIINK